jgi:hypothetical protein
MPIANCYVRDLIVSKSHIDELAHNWANDINVKAEDVCLTIIDKIIQSGTGYKVMINLFLPSLWGANDVNRIQKSLHNQFITIFGLNSSDIFIITSTVESGNVLENGKVVEW